MSTLGSGFMAAVGVWYNSHFRLHRLKPKGGGGRSFVPMKATGAETREGNAGRNELTWLKRKGRKGNAGIR